MVSEVAELDPVLSAFVRAHVGDPIAVEVVTGDHEDADVWRIEAPDGRRCYLKRPHHAGLVGRERNAYIALAPWLGDAIPTLVASADPPAGALLLSEAPGEALAGATLEPAIELEVHRRLGNLRRAFDRVPVDRDPVDPGEAVTRRMRHWLERAGSLDAATRERVRRAFDPRPLRGMSRAWCHRDLGPHNVRVELGGSRPIVRLIDLGRARPDVWLVDLAQLSMGPWRARSELATAFFTGYGREPTAREREGLRALALLHALATAAWGDAHGDHQRSARGRLELEQLLRSTA